MKLFNQIRLFLLTTHLFSVYTNLVPVKIGGVFIGIKRENGKAGSNLRLEVL